MDRGYNAPKQEDDLDDDDDFDGKGKAAQAANKGTSDFVKKLFSMLDDKAYESVVAWSPSGESFIVKDMNDFTKHVLPRNFRHSNFASFVRQLNKYDFHKVKNPEDGSGSGAVGEHVWEFQHPDFIRGREDLLENVKRKIPAKKKTNLKGGAAAEGERDDSPSIPPPVDLSESKMGESHAELRAQIAHLTANQDQMQNHILALTKQYQGVIGEMLTFQRNMVQQDQLMQNLIQYLMNVEQDRRMDGGQGPTSASAFLAQTGHASGNNNQTPFLSQASNYDNSGAPSSFGAQIGDMARRTGDSGSKGPGTEGSSSTHATSSARLSSMTTAPSTTAPLSPKSVASPMDSGKTPEVSNHPHAPPSYLTGQAESTSNPPVEQLSNNMPASDNRNGTQSAKAADASQPTTLTSLKKGGYASTVRGRRSTLVPGWSVPPRVLLVDDDEVCRRLSSKFLQVFGCTIDYAVDGMSAVNKMNLEKYDLVLMDIVMPNLDGASATSIIRQFDPNTPIISMTSNSGPSELINYMGAGMTDILPKPFTKEGLLNMLEKHLLHLKAQRGMSVSVGAPEQQQPPAAKALSPSPVAPGPGATPSNGAAGLNATEDASLNPLAGMGFTDEEYVAMLQNLIASGTGGDEDLSGVAGFMSSVADFGAHGMDSMGMGSKENTPATPTTAAGLKRSNSSTNDGTASANGSASGNGVRGVNHPTAAEANKRGRYNEIS